MVRATHAPPVLVTRRDCQPSRESARAKAGAHGGAKAPHSKAGRGHQPVGKTSEVLETSEVFWSFWA